MSVCPSPHHKKMARETFATWNEWLDNTTGLGVPFLAQRLTNLTRIREGAGLIPGLAQWVGNLALPGAVV